MKRVFKFVFSFCLFMLSINVKAIPQNISFNDENLYKCIIDAYNVNLDEKKDYNYSLLPEELNSITSLDCSNYKGQIENLSGLDKLINLTSLNLSGNVFLGGSLNILGESGKLKSNIILPPSLSLIDVTYTIENTKIVKIAEGAVYPLNPGSTYVTMTAKVSGNEIKEKYLVSVPGETIKKSNNAKLASLYLSKGEFSFDSDKKAYSVVVANSVDKVTINANVLDKKASFIPNYGPRTVNLKVGTNTLLVKVKAEDGTINTYTISVIRSDGNDLNSRLINIQLSVGKIEFDPDKYIYNFSVDSNVDEIDVKAVAESSLSKVEVSDTKLKVGNNKITITVTSESGNSSKYELIVNREDYDSLDNYLTNIFIDNYKINFNKNVFNYNLNINNENSLVIKPVVENKDATYKILGNTNLTNGSKIVVQVSDKEGSIREYNILINKKEVQGINLFDNLEIKWIILILEFVIILVLILVILFRGNNKPRKPKKMKKVKKIKQNKPVGASNICKACGTANDIKSKTCYVCGNLLK